jgi:hypothetical protein
MGIEGKARADALAQILFEKGVLDADDMNDLEQDGGRVDMLVEKYLSEL